VANAPIVVASVSGWRLQFRRVGRRDVACLRAGGASDGLVRAMFGLIIIVIIVYLIAMRPFRSAIGPWMRKMSDRFVRKP
jgi:hypothetical protein